MLKFFNLLAKTGEFLKEFFKIFLASSTVIIPIPLVFLRFEDKYH